MSSGLSTPPPEPVPTLAAIERAIFGLLSEEPDEVEESVEVKKPEEDTKFTPQKTEVTPEQKPEELPQQPVEQNTLTSEKIPQHQPEDLPQKQPEHNREHPLELPEKFVPQQQRESEDVWQQPASANVEYQPENFCENKLEKTTELQLEDVSTRHPESVPEKRSEKYPEQRPYETGVQREGVLKDELEGAAEPNSEDVPVRKLVEATEQDTEKCFEKQLKNEELAVQMESSDDDFVSRQHIYPRVEIRNRILTPPATVVSRQPTPEQIFDDSQIFENFPSSPRNYGRRIDNSYFVMDSVPKLVPSTRFTLAILCFFGCLFTYAMRINMSFAIVCMVAENKTDDSISTCGGSNVTSNMLAAQSSRVAEFDWPKETTGMILSSFFYGYTGSQILGGYLASRFGGKRVILVTILASSVFTLINPIAARVSPYFLIACRMLIGFLQGATFPAMHTMWSVWGPPLELSILTGVTYAGAQIGNVVVLSTAGFLCEYGFDGGWPSIFYIIGLCGVLWCAAWMYMVSDRPATHPWISPEEREYVVKAVEANLGKHTGKPPVTPWAKMLTSMPVWACWLGHFAADWGAYTMLVSLPTFLKDVLGLQLSALGLLAAIPYIAYFVAINVGGVLSDYVRSKGILSTVATRRTVMLLALIGQGGFLVAAGYCTCGQDALVIALVTAGMAISGLQYSGFVVNYLEIAPPFSGTVMGTGNTLSAIGGILSPTVTSFLVKNGTQEEWQTVMWLTAAILTAGAVAFAVFASSEVQPWARQPRPAETELLPLRAEKDID